MTHRSKMIAIGTILGLVALGALFRIPVRKWSKSAYVNDYRLKPVACNWRPSGDPSH